MTTSIQEFVPLRVRAIAKTEWIEHALIELEMETGWVSDWSSEASEVSSGEALVEFAGRSCYESWDKPNPRTATNAGYIEHILEVGHLSVLEHSSITFYVTGISRSLTHEQVRHRHFGYSQLSQRYVDPGNQGSDTGPVLPPLYEGDEVAQAIVSAAWQAARAYYEDLIKHAQEKNPGLPRKEYRQAARSVLPNLTETRIVMSANYRALRHFFHMRCALAADIEIRTMALDMLNQCKELAPSVFSDFSVKTDEQGNTYAESDFHES